MDKLIKKEIRIILKIFDQRKTEEKLKIKNEE